MREQLSCPENSTCFVEFLHPRSVQTMFPQVETASLTFPNDIVLSHGTEIEQTSIKVQICAAAMSQLVKQVIVLDGLKKVMLDGQERIVQIVKMKSNQLNLERGLVTNKTVFYYQEEQNKYLMRIVEREKSGTISKLDQDLKNQDGYYDSLYRGKEIMNKFKQQESDQKQFFHENAIAQIRRRQDERKLERDMELAIEQSLKLESRNFVDTNIRVIEEKSTFEEKKDLDLEFDPTRPLVIEIDGFRTSLMVYDPSKSTVGALLCVIFANYTVSDDSFVQIKSELGDLCLGSDDFPTYMSIGEVPRESIMPPRGKICTWEPRLAIQDM